MAHPERVAPSNDLETTDESLTIATIIVNGSVGLSGNITLINAKTALQLVEREVYNVLRSIGTDAGVAASIEFER